MWKEYVQPIVFVFADAPLYPGRNKTSFATSQYVTTHWLEIQDWVHQQLGYTFALMTPMNVAANPSAIDVEGSTLVGNQAEYTQHSIFKELYLRNIIDLTNPNILYYVHCWGPNPEMAPIGCYDGKAWGFDTDAGRCMTQPGGLGLLDICELSYWEVVSGYGAWSNHLVKGACLHELGHGMAALPDGKSGDEDIMWSWWKWPKTFFTDEQKMKLLKSRWMWIK